MRKATLTYKDNSRQIYKKICMIVHFFIFDKTKWIFSNEFGISHSQQNAQYSSAQHDILTIDYYSFWYATESGEKEQFLHCSRGISNVTIDGISVEEKPDASTLFRLAKVFSAAQAKYIYEMLEKMFVFANHGLTVDQYYAEHY